MKKVLQPGTHLVHLSKVGSDFATDHGKLHQKKEGDIDEDGSHNSGFHTLLLSKVTTVHEERTPLIFLLGFGSC